MQSFLKKVLPSTHSSLSFVQKLDFTLPNLFKSSISIINFTRKEKGVEKNLFLFTIFLKHHKKHRTSCKKYGVFLFLFFPDCGAAAWKHIAALADRKSDLGRGYLSLMLLADCHTKDILHNGRRKSGCIGV